jgi:cysteine desulfurase family protein (TIGR01976 family)
LIFHRKERGERRDFALSILLPASFAISAVQVYSALKKYPKEIDVTAFDPYALRQQFPALAQTFNGQPLVFFDGPGGTQVPQRVIDAVSRYYTEMNSNCDGAFITSQRSDAMLAAAHVAMAEFLNAGSPEEIAFSQNMTTHTFNLSRALGQTLKSGDDLMVTMLDHEANSSPWVALEERGVRVHWVDTRRDPEDCTLDMADFESKLSARTKIVAIGYASNAVGTINDVKTIVDMAHTVGALTYVDAVHYAPHGPIDVQSLDCDFLVCSVYKFFGPHLGVLYGKQDVLDRLPAYKVRPAAHSRFETGTQNHEGIAGALAAVEYLADIGRTLGAALVNQYSNFPGRRLELKAAMNAIRDYERILLEQLMEGLKQIPGLKIWGITDPAQLARRTPTIAFTLESFSPREVAEYLGQRGICVWDGHFYAQALMERLGLSESGGVVRVGLVHYNTSQEVDRLLVALRELAKA